MSPASEDLRARLQQSLAERRAGSRDSPAPVNGSSPAPVDDSDPDYLFSRLKSRVPAISGYKKWFPGKRMRPSADGVVAQCFNLGAHPKGDQHPQLSLYPGDRGFYCHACQISGTIVDLAAVAYGEHDGSFRAPRSSAGEIAARATLELLGIEMEKVAGDYWRDVPPPAAPSAGGTEDWFLQTVGEINGSYVPEVAPAEPENTPEKAPEKPEKAPEKAPEQPKQPENTPEKPEKAPEAPETPGKAPEKPRIDDNAAPSAPEPPPRDRSFHDDTSALAVHPSDPLGRAKAVRERLTEAGRSFVPLVERPPRDGEIIAPPFDPLPMIPEGSTFLRPYLEFTRDHFGAPSWHLFSAMMAIGMATGKHRWTDGSRIHGNMIVCLVGKVAGGKTSSFEVAKRIVEAALPLDETDPWSEGVRIAGNVASGPALIGAFIHEVPMDIPVPDRTMPPLPDGSYPPKLDSNGDVVTKASTEQGTRTRVLAEYSELSTLRAKSSSESSTIQQTLMDAYDGHAVTNRTRGYGEENVRDPYCSVMTTTQPRMLRKLITAEHIASGFASRILFVLGRDRVPPAMNSVNHYDPPDRLVRALRAIDIACRERPGEIGFADADAEAYWTGIYAEDLYAMRDKAESSTLEHLAARNVLAMRKIMLLLAVDCGRTAIDCDIITRAHAIWGFIAECMLIVAGEAAETEEPGELWSRIERQVEEHMAEHEGRGATMRHLQRRLSSTDKAELGRMVEQMVRAGALEKVRAAPGPQGGRPTERLVVPSA